MAMRERQGATLQFNRVANCLSMHDEIPKNVMHHAEEFFTQRDVNSSSPAFRNPTFLDRNQIDCRPEMIVSGTQMRLFVDTRKHRSVTPAAP